MLAPAFSKIKTGAAFPQRTTPTGTPQVKLHHRDLEQVQVCLCAQGISIKDSRRYPFSLLNTIFGGNMSSRLFQKIREARGLAYSVYSFVSSFEDTGMFGAYAGVKPDKVHETVTLMVEEMHNLKSRRVDASELTDAKNYTKGNLLLAAESVDNQMVRLAQNEINFDRHIPLEEVIDAIESVSSDDIIELAQTIFAENRIALTTLGPMSDAAHFEKLLYEQ
jgi:predicted Zn-dependent peptidase